MVSFVVCCNVLWCVVMCCSVCCSVLRLPTSSCIAAALINPIAVCCSVLQCVAVCCSVLQCVAVCCRLGSSWWDSFIARTGAYSQKSDMRPVIRYTQVTYDTNHMVLIFTTRCCVSVRSLVMAFLGRNTPSSLIGHPCMRWCHNSGGALPKSTANAHGKWSTVFRCFAVFLSFFLWFWKPESGTLKEKNSGD